MQSIEVRLESHSYPVYTGSGLLQQSGLWARHLAPGKILIVSNDVVAPLYLEPVRQALSGRVVEHLILPDGEAFKTLDTFSTVVDQLVRMKARRDSNLLALGGGVVGDIGGFSAACYMRGIRLLQAPTTLLAQVDSSVGGKTGVNHAAGKNLVGAFHQPAAVIADMDTLETLPRREFRAGLAEVVKYGAIRDADFFEWLERNTAAILQRDSNLLAALVQTCVENKAAVVAQDEREAGLRATLNFGHTFGHALEAVTAYQAYLHGEAVAVGMVLAAKLSHLRGLCDDSCANRLEALLETFGLPLRIPRTIVPEALYEFIELDKKAVSSGLRFVLLSAIGQSLIHSESMKDDILSVIRQSQQNGEIERHGT